MTKIIKSKLREGVRRAYNEAAENPAADHPFPVGRTFAESLGYPAGLLEELPAVSVEAFTGVSNLAILAEIPTGATVLDLGCGGGLDSLIAARRAGPTGRVICVDFSQPMLSRARQGGMEARAENIDYHLSNAEGLPIPDQSVDVALANGIFNLNPDRGLIFRELARVVKPGGSVYAAELILREGPAHELLSREPFSEEVEADESTWFA